MLWLQELKEQVGSLKADMYRLCFDKQAIFIKIPLYINKLGEIVLDGELGFINEQSCAVA